jgi:hypothetical protein
MSQNLEQQAEQDLIDNYKIICKNCEIKRKYIIIRKKSFILLIIYIFF